MEDRASAEASSRVCVSEYLAAPCEEVLCAMASLHAHAPSLCQRASEDAFVHVMADGKRRVKKMSSEWKNHYMFLYAAGANCVECVAHWLCQGADPRKGSLSQNWTAMDWAEHHHARDVKRLLTTELAKEQSAKVRKVESSDTSGNVATLPSASTWPLCPAAEQDRLAHVEQNKYKVKVEALVGDVQNRYLCMYAAEKNCVKCVQHWIHLGVDVNATTKNHKHSVRDWAEWGQATDVLAVLSMSEKSTKVELEKDDEETDELSGVWRDVESDADVLENLLQSGASCDFWRAAVSGDEPTWQHCIHVLSCPVPLPDCADRLPDRMWYWQLAQFVELGQIALKQQGLCVQGEKLERCHCELRRIETDWVDGIMRYLGALPDDHVDRLAWDRCAAADLAVQDVRWCFEAFCCFASLSLIIDFVYVHDRCEQDAIVDSDDRTEAEDRKGFWTSALRAVLCATSPNFALFQGYLELSDWVKYDVFLTAADIGLTVPEPCEAWRLDRFVHAVHRWQEKDTSNLVRDTLFKAMSEKIDQAYWGRHCWYMREKEILSQLMCTALSGMTFYE